MNRIQRFKDLSPNEINKINERIDFDVTYEIKGTDINGDDVDIIEEDDDANYNPYDLKDMVRLLIKKNKEYSSRQIPSSKSLRLFLIKVTRERVPHETLEKIRLELTTDKYNL